MACERFAQALKGSTLGAPLPADAAAHLAVCSSCQALVEAEARLQQTIADALAEVASARPAPGFMARIRERVERTPQRVAPAWLQPAAVAAATVVIAVIIAGRFRYEKPASYQTATVSQRRSADDSSTSTVPNPGVIEQTVARKPAARGRRQPAVRAGANAVPEVLVPAQQREAVGRLFDSLRAGRPDVVSTLMNLHAAANVSELKDLTIAPIRIEPVVVSALPPSPPIVDK
jgi:hypothetical protein